MTGLRFAIGCSLLAAHWLTGAECFLTVFDAVVRNEEAA